jgi:hypothetical protein
MRRQPLHHKEANLLEEPLCCWLAAKLHIRSRPVVDPASSCISKSFVIQRFFISSSLVFQARSLLHMLATRYEQAACES